MSSPRKVVSSISKELQRHVQSTSNRSRVASNTLGTRSSLGNSNDQGRSTGRNMSNTLLGCVAFVGVTASIPFLRMQWIGPLNEREEVSFFRY